MGWPCFQEPRGLVQTCIREKASAALACGLGEEGFQSQSPVGSLFASSLPAFLDGDIHRVPGGREEMLALMLPPCPTLLPSLHPLGREKPGADTVSLALGCSDRTPFPKWAAGVSQLPAAVDVLTCESPQLTPPSWDSRAAEPLEACLCGSSEKGCVCVFDATALGALPRTLIFGEACLGVRRGQASCRTSEIPQPFCALHGADQECLLFEMLLEWVESWPWAHGEGNWRLYPQGQVCPSILDRRLKECSIGASDLCLQGWEKASSLPTPGASHTLKCT